MTSVTCGTCGVQVESGEAGGRLEYAGHTYYFCSQACVELFADNPADYVSHQPLTADRTSSE
jgi:YHS domain-containing protein